MDAGRHKLHAGRHGNETGTVGNDAGRGGDLGISEGCFGIREIGAMRFLLPEAEEGVSEVKGCWGWTASLMSFGEQREASPFRLTSGGRSFLG